MECHRAEYKLKIAHTRALIHEVPTIELMDMAAGAAVCLTIHNRIMAIQTMEGK